jgi:hypothetical protein
VYVSILMNQLFYQLIHLLSLFFGSGIQVHIKVPIWCNSSSNFLVSANSNSVDLQKQYHCLLLISYYQHPVYHPEENKHPEEIPFFVYCNRPYSMLDILSSISSSISFIFSLVNLVSYIILSGLKFFISYILNIK